MYRISAKLSLPEDAARWTFADLAIKGAGKTYAASVLAEEFIKNGIPIIVVDPLDIWWGLRVGVDGHDGLPVVVFGGKHQDLPIPTNFEKGHEIVDEGRLKLMVKAILESRMSAVLEVKTFSKSMQRRIVAIFVSELNRLNEDYGIRHVFLEESDEWVPQHQRMSDAWASQAFGAVDNLVRQGGNFLLGCTLITQRSAVLNKDVLTQINCLIALRTIHDLDKKAVALWVKSASGKDKKEVDKFVDSLRSLKNGEAWIWHPEEPELFDRIQFRKRETLHATREYFTRSEFEQKDIAMQDVGAFVAKFKKVFEPVKAAPKPVEAAKTLIEVGHNGSSHNRTLGEATERLMATPPALREIHDKVERQMDEPQPSRTPIGAFTLEVSRLQSESLEAKLLYIVKNRGAGRQAELLKVALEFGWNISQSGASEALKRLREQGLLIYTGHQDYRLPTDESFKVMEVIA